VEHVFDGYLSVGTMKGTRVVIRSKYS